MAQRGIYAAPCEVKPNRDRTDTTEITVKEQKLWGIEFSIKGVGNVCAVVKARNPKEAEALLKADGSLNGTPFMYNITRIEEVVPSPESMFIAEQIATNND